jgi:hypothetical protein
MHFTPTHLVVLSDEGVYRLYDLSNPQSYTQHTLGSEAGELGVVSAKAYDEGFVVLTGGLQFLEVRGWKGGRVSPLAASGEPSLVDAKHGSDVQVFPNHLLHGR